MSEKEKGRMIEKEKKKNARTENDRERYAEKRENDRRGRRMMRGKDIDGEMCRGR